MKIQENSTSSKNIGGIGPFYRNYRKYRKSCQAWKWIKFSENQTPTPQIYHFSGMSKRDGGDRNATVTRGLCVKTYKPKVKSSKSAKQLRSYGMFSKAFSHAYMSSAAAYLMLHRRLLNAAQTPT